MSRRTIAGNGITRTNGTRAWCLPYRVPETGRSTSKMSNTKGAAEAFVDELQHGRRTGTWVAPDAGRETFEAFATEWAAMQDWAPSTRVAFAASLKRIVRRFGPERRLDEVDELTLSRLRQSLVDDYARATATSTLHYAAAVMRAAYRLRRISRDVTETLQPPKNRSGRADGVSADDGPSRSDVVAIMGATPTAWRAAISLGASGLRVSEMLGVHAEQYDRATGVLRVDRQLQRIDGRDAFPLPKRDKIRTITLPDWARFDMDSHLDERQVAGLLFRGRLGDPKRRDLFYSSVWRPALVAAGVGERRYKFHSLRHWCASSMLAKGAPLSAVAGHLGDTIETVSRTYVHWLRDDRKTPAEVLSRMLRPTLKIVDSA